MKRGIRKKKREEKRKEEKRKEEKRREEKKREEKKRECSEGRLGSIWWGCGGCEEQEPGKEKKKDKK